MANALLLVQLLLQYGDKIKGLGELLTRAHSGGAPITDAEVDAAFGADDAAKARAQAAIDAAKAAGNG